MSILRFGIWALVHGSRGAFQDPDEPLDASWDRNRRLVLEAEALGYDSTLIAQHTANPYDEEWDELEAWTAAAALAALTQRIDIAEGRFAINLVNAWNRGSVPMVARRPAWLAATTK